MTNNNEINITIQVRLNKACLKKILFLFFIFIMIVFLFVDVRAQQNHRLIRDIWDAGHLVLFGLLSFSYFNQSSHSSLYRIVFTSIFCIVVGTAIEGVQLFLQRGFSYNDIVNDVFGGYLGLLCITMLDREKTTIYRTIAGLIFVLALVVGLRDFQKHLFDEYNMQSQFPVLADFETLSEMERWEFSNVIVRRSDKYVMSGFHSLKVEYQPAHYSQISLQHLKEDWSGYAKLMISIFNPKQEDVNLEVKIFDKKHMGKGGGYHDRFNKNITLKYGWNIVEISLSDIINAPRQRLINMKEIKSFSLFTNNLSAPVSIYIDHIYLVL